MTASVIHADCLDAMRAMEADSIDAIVTDPPYGLAFMGREWDHGVPGVPFWTEALRVAKPGAHLVAFGGTRTFHRLACAIEDAGWEVRDCLSWLYGSGFPKSLDVLKAIDKGTGENFDRQLRFTSWMRSTGISVATINAATGSSMGSHYLTDKSQPAIATADMFDLLRPHLPEVPEEIERLVAERTGIEWTAYKQREVVGQKTAGIANPDDNDRHTVGGSRAVVVDITAPATDAARAWNGWGTALKPAWEPAILARKPLVGTVAANVLAHGTGAINVDACRIEGAKPATTRSAGGAHGIYHNLGAQGRIEDDGLGRWPANVALDEEAAAMLDTQTGVLTSGDLLPTHYLKASENRAMSGANQARAPRRAFGGDSGGASRFFYTAKASRRERGEGNTHPTVKPLALMRWCVRLVTPPGGLVLDPFCGSGTTLLAARAEGFRSVGVEREAEYVEIIRRRLSESRDLFSEAT